MNEVVIVEPQTPPTPRFLRVRPAFWLLLTGSVLLTLLAPAFVLWRASALPLAARACLWPDTPRAGVPAYMLVTLTNPRDRSAVHGSWAQLVVNWDMTTMPMGTRAVVMHGGPSTDSAAPAQADDSRVFVIPLRLSMSGPWWARVSLQTPGRPTWVSELRFMVGPPGSASAGQSTLSRAPCAAASTA
jgi:hypothetical protein